jgi:hypothetical protein
MIIVFLVIFHIVCIYNAVYIIYYTIITENITISIPFASFFFFVCMCICKNQTKVQLLVCVGRAKRSSGCGLTYSCD